MKTSLIVTTQYVYNYGAVLQAYGFHAFLNDNGWKHEFLNMIPSNANIFESIRALNSSGLYSIVKNFRRFRHLTSIKKRRIRFDEFVLRNLPQTRRFTSQDEILNTKMYYDIYITGGDQMFNRSCLNRPSNLLRFGNEEATRISYSTSFGSASFSENECEYLQASFNRYNEISLREGTLPQKVQEGITTKTRIDIDGSMLIDPEEWCIVASAVQGMPEQYILVYELLPNDNLQLAIDKAKQVFGVPVVILSCNDKCTVRGDYVIRDAGPGEFIWLFSHCEAVITTSFHGTCFSIIFHKPFFSLIRKNETRINSLLQSLGLEEYYGSEFTGWPNLLPDFRVADKYMLDGRRQAKSYLERYFNE